MFAVADPELAQRLAQQRQLLGRLLGRADVGLADDLDQRHAGAVVVDDGVEPWCGPRRRVHELAASSSRWMPVQRARSPEPRRRCRAARRTARSDSPWAGRDRSSACAANFDRGGDLAAERQPEAQAELDRPAVEHRQRARQAEADRADARVGLGAEAQLRTRRTSSSRRELDVDLEADDGFVVGVMRGARGASTVGRAASNACAARRMPVLAQRAGRRSGGRPAGRSVRPHGIEIAGRPARSPAR